jgi:hypothetical protein
MVDVHVLATHDVYTLLIVARRHEAPARAHCRAGKLV